MGRKKYYTINRNGGIYGTANLKYLEVTKQVNIFCSTEELAFAMGNLMMHYKHLDKGTLIFDFLHVTFSFVNLLLTL